MTADDARVDAVPLFVDTDATGRVTIRPQGAVSMANGHFRALPAHALDTLLTRLAVAEAAIATRDAALAVERGRAERAERERDDMEAVLIEANEDIQGVTPADTIRRILRQRDEARALLEEVDADPHANLTNGLKARIATHLRGGEVKRGE